MTNQEPILLVEDNVNDIELTLDAFQVNNISNPVQIARDGAEALEYLFHTGAYSHLTPTDVPTLVLLDLKLPKIDGLEILRRIRSDPRIRRISVVMLTSSREEQDIVGSYDLGVKPVDFDQFNAAVQTLGLYWLVINQPPPPTVP